MHAFDLTDRDKIESLFAARAFDAVIHFAGLKAVGESVDVPLDYYQNNLDSTFSLVAGHAAARRAPAGLLLLGHRLRRAAPRCRSRRTSPTSATNPYGWTKVMIEQVLRDVAAHRRRWRIALLRYFNPVGAHRRAPSARTRRASRTT